jgi:acetyl-CoA C-acetyltransferase
VRVLGTGHATGPVTLWEMEDITSFSASVRASREAYAAAGIGPMDVDVAEVHDCFTVAEIIATEDLGFVPKGQGGPAVLAGGVHDAGSVVVNPSGGLIGKGHPVGATGCAQVHELVKQFRNAAANQASNAEIGLAHNLGGCGAVSTVTILARM